MGLSGCGCILNLTPLPAYLRRPAVGHRFHSLALIVDVGCTARHSTSNLGYIRETGDD